MPIPLAFGYDETVTDPAERWAVAAIPVYTWGAALSSLIWFGFAVGSGVTGHPVLAGLFGVVGLLILVAALQLRRRFERRSDANNLA